VTESTQQTQPTPLIQVFTNFDRIGKRIISNSEITRDSVQSWNSRVRLQLSKLLGPDGPHIVEFAELPRRLSAEEARAILEKRLAHLGRIASALEVVVQTTASGSPQERRVFIGHGRSPLWRELKDFLADRLKLPWEEFNRTPVAGIATSARLDAMLSQSRFAFLVMTAEEERGDATLHARDNVIHEVGLFQGRLGFKSAIVLLEDGCAEISNIVGLTQIRFPRDDISARFEEVRAVLEREGMV
jgi:predicted nucleotide-binding protein